MIASYPHFLGLSTRLQWDAEAVDLTAAAAAWPSLDSGLRDRLLALIAGFCVGEDAVADELPPFETSAGDPVMAACFAAQTRDERRHARFFQRVATEVAGVGEPTHGGFWQALRRRLDPAFLELFDDRLPAAARGLAADHGSLPDAVALYHMVLEGVVFAAGQSELLALTDRHPDLSELRGGVELVVRDERWHVGFGLRCLADAGMRPSLVSRILAEGQRAAAVWQHSVDPQLPERVREAHRRRLTAIGAVPPRTSQR